MKSQNAEVIDHIKRIRRFHRQTCHSPKNLFGPNLRHWLCDSENFEQFHEFRTIHVCHDWFNCFKFELVFCFIVWSFWQNQLVWRERTWKMLISWNVEIAYFINFNTFVSVRNDVFVTKWKLRFSTRYCVHAFFIIEWHKTHRWHRLSYTFHTWGCVR